MQELRVYKKGTQYSVGFFNRSDEEFEPLIGNGWDVVIHPNKKEAVTGLIHSLKEECDPYIVGKDNIYSYLTGAFGKEFTVFLGDRCVTDEEFADSYGNEFNRKRFKVGDFTLNIESADHSDVPENDLVYDLETKRFGFYAGGSFYYSKVVEELYEQSVSQLPNSTFAKRLQEDAISSERSTILDAVPTPDTKGNTMIDKIVKKTKTRVVKAAYRTAARKTVLKAQELLIKALKARKVDNFVIQFVESFLKTKTGRNAFGLILGLSAEYAADKLPIAFFKDERFGSLFEALQDECSTELMDVVVTEAMSFALPLLSEVVRELPVEKTRIADKVTVEDDEETSEKKTHRRKAV